MRIGVLALSFLVSFSGGIVFTSPLIPEASAQVPPGEVVFSSSFEGGPFNEAPSLDAIGPREIDLGASLDLQLNATDPEDDPLFFSAFPMPENAALDALSGEFSFHPDASQAGEIDITFLVSDGILSDSETVTITVSAAPPQGITKLSGRLLDTNDFVADGTETPIEGAVVSILGSGVSTLSGSDGRFSLEAIPAGEQVFDIDPAGVVAPDDSDYAGFREALTIIEGVDNLVERPFYLPRIDMDSLTPVNPAETAIVTNPNIGAELIVAAESAYLNGELFDGELSISPVPDALAPASLPPELGFAQLITIQPVGVIFNTPALLTVPNIDGLPPGSELDLWSLDPNSGKFVIVGTGRVSADGSVIETISGGVRAADWHDFLPPAPAGQAVSQASRDLAQCCARNTGAGSRMSIASGNLTVMRTLPAYRSQGVNRALTLVYNSEGAYPRPRFTSNPVILARAAVPSLVSSRLFLSGIDTGSELYTATSGLSESRDEELRQVIQFDGSPFATGRYHYSMTQTSHYNFSSVAAQRSGSVLVDNRIHSEFGPGWSLLGVKRVYDHPDGSIVLQEGNGSVKSFQRKFAGDGTFGGTLSLEIGPGPKNIVTGDFNGDEYPDFAVASGNFPTDKHVNIYVNDGQGVYTVTRILLPGTAAPLALAAGNIDGNAHVDFVVTTILRVYKILADGAGGWNPPVSMPWDPADSGVSNARSLVLTDLNGDGIDDPVYPNFESSDPTHHLNVHLSNGPNSHDFAVQVEVGQDPQHVEAGALNGDDRPDLVVANRRSDNVSVLLGLGGADFSATSVPVDEPIHLALADLTNDGHLDLAVVLQTSLNLVKLFRGSGNGVFTPMGEIPSNAPQAVATGNLNRDNSPDVVVLSRVDGDVKVYLNNGAGAFPVSELFFAGHLPGFLAIADADTDGKNDVLVSTNSTGNTMAGISILHGDDRGSLTDTDRYFTPTGSLSSTAADFNNDGFDDVAAQYQNGVAVFLSNGDGTLSQPILWSAGGNSTSMAAGDFDGDGSVDLALPRIGARRLDIAFGTGAGQMRDVQQIPIRCGEASCSARLVTALDIDRDGSLDFAVVKTVPDSGADTDDWLQFYFNGGDGEFNPGPEFDIPDFPEDAKSADLDKDGFPDLVVVDGRDLVSVLFNDQAGGLLPPDQYAVGDKPRKCAIADLNNDGYPDIITAAEGSGEVWKLLNNRNRTLSVQSPIELTQFNLSTDPKGVDAADLNGDGNTDIVVTLQSAGLAVTLLGDGTGQFVLGERNDVGWDTESIVVLDLDDDGANDMVSANNNEAIVAVLRGNRSGIVTGARSPRGDFSTMIPNDDGTFTRRLKNGHVEQYDAGGLMTETSDRNGNTTTYNYGPSGGILSIRDAVGLVTEFAYNGDKVKTITGPAGRTTSLQHGQDDNLVKITVSDGTAWSFEYDERRRMVKQTSRRGFESENEYDFSGSIRKVTRSDGSVHTLDPSETVGLFDPALGIGTRANPAPVIREEDAVATHTDGRGHATTYRTNAFGASTETTDGLGRKTLFTRNLDNLPVSIEPPTGALETRSYDEAGNLLQLRQAVGTPLERELRIIWDQEINRPKQLIDFMGNKSIAEYDDNGNLVKATDALGGERNFMRLPNGQIQEFTNELGHTTSFQYDPQGNLKEFVNAMLEKTRIGRDPAGDMTSTTIGADSPDAITMNIERDHMGRISAIEDARGVRLQYSYNEDGSLREAQLSPQETTRIYYSERDFVSRIEHPRTGTTKFTYDAEGNPLTRTDAVGNTEQWAYDAANRPVVFTDANGQEQTVRWTDGNELESITDPLGGIWKNEYNLRDERTRSETPGGRVVSWEYDNNGNRISETRPDSTVINWTYDALDRLIGIDTPDDTITTARDAVGNPIVVENSVARTERTYDGVGRLVGEKNVDKGNAPAFEITHLFNDAGLRIGFDESLGGSVRYGLDGAGAIEEIVTTGSHISISRNASGSVAQIAYPGDVVRQNEFGPAGKLTGFSIVRDSSSSLLDLDFTYLPDGKIGSIDNQSETINIGYDPLGQVTTAGSDANPEFYDWTWYNRESSHVSNFYGFDPDHVVEETESYLFTSDPNGNPITKENKSSAQSTTFGWNAFGLLEVLSYSGGIPITYYFDGFGRLAGQEVDEVRTWFVYDGLNIIAEMDDSGVVRVRNTFAGQGGAPLIVEEGGIPIYLHTDQAGSVIAATDILGELEGSREYDAFGNEIDSSGTVPGSYGIHGLRQVDVGGNYYSPALGSNVYDPEIGRSLNGGTGALQPDSFVSFGNDPVNVIDVAPYDGPAVSIGQLPRPSNFDYCPDSNGLGNPWPAECEKRLAPHTVNTCMPTSTNIGIQQSCTRVSSGVPQVVFDNNLVSNPDIERFKELTQGKPWGLQDLAAIFIIALVDPDDRARQGNVAKGKTERFPNSAFKGLTSFVTTGSGYPFPFFVLEEDPLPTSILDELCGEPPPDILSELDTKIVWD